MNKILKILYDAWEDSKIYCSDGKEYDAAVRLLTDESRDSEKLKVLDEAVSAEKMSAFEEGFNEAAELFINL